MRTGAAARRATQRGGQRDGECGPSNGPARAVPGQRNAPRPGHGKGKTSRTERKIYNPPNTAVTTRPAEQDTRASVCSEL